MEKSSPRHPGAMSNFALGVLHVADKYGLSGPMQGEVALSALVRQDDKIGVLAWDWVSARCTTHDVG